MNTQIDLTECCHICHGAIPGREDAPNACDPCNCKAKMRAMEEEIASLRVALKDVLDSVAYWRSQAEETRER